MAEFLRQLAATNNVAAAAKTVGMSRQSAYRLRARHKGRPFDIGWEAAFQRGYDNLAQVALERALNGVEAPHYHKGEPSEYYQILPLGVTKPETVVGFHRLFQG